MKSIKYCLNKQLADICQRSVQLEELSEKINAFLPQELATQCHASSFTKGCLVLVTANATWASQIRYAIPQLRDQLRAAGMYQLLSIKVSIECTKQEIKKVKKSTHYQMTEQTRETILSESQSCSYEPLRQALLHLAQAKV